MKAAEMHCIKASHAHEYEDPSKQSLLSPGDGYQTHVLPHHLQVINTRQVTAYLLQEAGGVRYTSAIYDALLTPPQVDTSICKHVRKKKRTYTIRMWEWKTCSSLAVYRSFLIFPSKKSVAQSSLSLAAYSSERDTASLWLFCWVSRDSTGRRAHPFRIHRTIILRAVARKRAIQVSFSTINITQPLSRRRESQMLSQQPTISTTTNHKSLVDRVLHLRRQLGIDLSLSLRNSEDMPLSLKEHPTSFIEIPQHASRAYGSQGWLTWSQSPCEGSLPEKGQEELRRCP